MFLHVLITVGLGRGNGLIPSLEENEPKHDWRVGLLLPLLTGIVNVVDEEKKYPRQSSSRIRPRHQ
jgi:hypothetical protein